MRALILGIATVFVCAHALAQVPTRVDPTKRPAQPIQTVPTAAPTPAPAPRPVTPPPAAQAPSASSTGTRAQLPVNPQQAAQRQPTSATPSSSAKSNDPLARLIERAKRDGVKTFRCPATLEMGATPGTMTSLRTFAFESAGVSSGACASYYDLAPTTDRGLRCMECRYGAGLTLRRSAPKEYSCWVKPDASSTFACEHVPPPPAGQTCRFEITLRDVDLHPFTNHTRGDTDMDSEGGVFEEPAFPDLIVDASITRNADELTLQVHGTVEEGGGDRTTFNRSLTRPIASVDIENGTKADVAACLASYGANRPFPAIEGRIRAGSAGHSLREYHTGPDHDLQFKVQCRTDTEGDDEGQVGCDPIEFDRLTITIR